MADPISVISSVGSVIGTSARIIQQVHRISQYYVGNEMYIAQIVAECSAVRAALVQLQSSLKSTHMPGVDAQTRDDVLSSVEAVTVACAMSLSMLEKYVDTCLQAVPDRGDGISEVSEPVAGLSRRKKTTVAWNHDEIGHHLQQVRGCQSSLTLLLNVLQCQSTARIWSSLTDNRGTLEGLRMALRNADIDGASMSRMTLRVEEAVEIIDWDEKGLVPVAQSGGNPSHYGQSQSRIQEINEASEVQSAAEEQAVAAETTTAIATSSTTSTDAVNTAMKQENSPKRRRRPLIVNLLQNILKERPPRPLPVPIARKAPGRIEFSTDRLSMRASGYHIKVCIFGPKTGNRYGDSYATIFRPLHAHGSKNVTPCNINDDKNSAWQTQCYEYNSQHIEARFRGLPAPTDEALEREAFLNADLCLFTTSMVDRLTLDEIYWRWHDSLGWSTSRCILLCLDENCGDETQAIKGANGPYWSADKVDRVSENDIVRLAQDMGALAYLKCQVQDDLSEVRAMVKQLAYFSTAM